MGVIMGSLFAAYKHDQQGNVAMMFGGIIFLLLGLLALAIDFSKAYNCLLYTSPSPRDQRGSRMPSSA